MYYEKTAVTDNPIVDDIKEFFIDLWEDVKDAVDGTVGDTVSDTVADADFTDPDAFFADQSQTSDDPINPTIWEDIPDCDTCHPLDETCNADCIKMTPLEEACNAECFEL